MEIVSPAITLFSVAAELFLVESAILPEVEDLVELAFFTDGIGGGASTGAFRLRSSTMSAIR